jgi:phage tail-like protein
MATQSPYPFVAFSFAVEITTPTARAGTYLCGASFQECDGIELGMDVKTIREGGNNDTQIRLAGPVALGTLILKRGMTSDFGLWQWFQAVIADPSVRYDASVVMTAPKNIQNSVAHFLLTRCIPQKLKAPPLNAKDGTLAIEELTLAYETLTLVEASQ